MQNMVQGRDDVVWFRVKWRDLARFERYSGHVLSWVLRVEKMDFRMLPKSLLQREEVHMYEIIYKQASTKAYEQC